MNPHLQPWRIVAGEFPADGFASDRLEFLLGYAVLAPSPHNTQPWLFRINVDDVELFADRRRALPIVDPDQRELHMACGAALFNLRVAAEYFGQTYAVDLLPDAQRPALLARFALRPVPAETTSEDVVLFNALTQRRTNREPFLPGAIAEEILADLAEAARQEGAWFGVAIEEAARHAVADLVAQADRIQWANRDFRRELSTWLRSDAEHQCDGIPIREVGVQDWMAFAGPVLIRTFNRGNNQAARDREIATHSPVLAVLGTDRDDPEAWLRAGQALERVLLHAQANGVAVSFLSQAVEVPDLRRQLSEFYGLGAYPQVLLRMGYGLEVAPTPRHGARSRLLKQDPSKAPPH